LVATEFGPEAAAVPAASRFLVGKFRNKGDGSMPSIVDSEYLPLCREFLASVEERPGMFF